MAWTLLSGPPWLTPLEHSRGTPPTPAWQAGWLWTRPPTLASAASPEAGSGCPMFDFVDPISSGSRRVVQRARSMPFSSWGSPTCGGQKEGQDPS